jgi:protein-S-isoprenylcysteine O-methyltransferase Ste14
LMPNIWSALIAVLLPVGLSMEAAAEEAYLKRVHGERYLRYIAATGKWLPHLRSR